MIIKVYITNPYSRTLLWNLVTAELDTQKIKDGNEDEQNTNYYKTSIKWHSGINDDMKKGWKLKAVMGDNGKIKISSR